MNDIRTAFRSLFKTPSFALLAIATLALGIGATTAIFSIINGVLLRPLPYPDPDRIVTIWQSEAQSGNQFGDVSPPNFLDLEERSRSFASVGAVDPWGLDLEIPGRPPETLPALRVSPGFFEVLKAPPFLGRVLKKEDFQKGRHHVVVMDYHFWARRFGADPKVIGRMLRLDGVPHEVVGVMRPEFSLTSRLYDQSAREGGRVMFSPVLLGEDNFKNRKSTFLRAIGRLAPGVTLQQARAEAEAIGSNLAKEFPDANATMGFTVVPLYESMVGGVRRLLLILGGSVGFVLLIACANIANLLLVRATTRGRELAVRAALGAGRWRLARLLLTEGLLLGIMGGVSGVLLSILAIQFLVALAPPGLPRAGEIALDLRVLFFALAATLVSALIFSAFPALHFSRTQIESKLRSAEHRGTAGSPVRAFRIGLVAVEICLAVILLAGAGLLARSFYSILKVDPGFRPEKLILVQLFVWDRYDSAEKRIEFFRQAAEELRVLPDVTDVGAASAVPFAPTRIDFDVNFVIPGRPAPRREEEPTGFLIIATPDYFRAMGMTVRQGRTFSNADDTTSEPVAVINEEMARRHWPGANPIGQQVNIRFGKPTPHTIIGVVGDVRHSALDAAPRPELFIPHGRVGYGSMTLVVRTRGDSAALVKPVQETLWRVNPTLPIYGVDLMSTVVRESLAQRRFVLMLLAGFSILALILAAIGIYGVISYTTAQRTREMGIRAALGAARADVLALIIRESFRIAVLGILLGVFGAILLTRSLRGMLFQVGHTDPLTFGSTAALLALVAIAASYIPARRAAAVEPATALRYE